MKTIDNILKVFQELNDEKENLIKELQNSDKQISEIIHIIEFNKFNQVESHKFIKRLKQLRINRRTAKEKLHQITLLRNHTNKLFSDVERVKKSLKQSELKRLENKPSDDYWKQFKKEALSKIK